MKQTFRFETRWKVIKKVHTSDLQDRLNKLQSKGWEIMPPHAHSLYWFTVIAKRRIRVRNK